MKSKAILLSFALLLLACANFSQTIGKAADAPEQTAKDFYAWYLKELSREKIRIDKKQMLKYVSKRLGKWYLSPAYAEYGADYFLDAQNFDEKWQVTTGNAVIKGNTATLKIILAAQKSEKSDWANTLAVKMILENGAWKIDSVNNRKF